MMSEPHDLLFNGRTLLVECVFLTIVDPKFVADRAMAACAGPKLRMVVGGLSLHPGGYKAKTFVNTDELETELRSRVMAMNPRPSSITIDIVSARDAKELWAEAKNAMATRQ